MTPYNDVMNVPYFLIIAMTMQECVFLQIFSVYNPQVWEKYSVAYHIRHFDFQMRSKKLYTLRVKDPRMNNPDLPFPFPIPTL